MADIAMQLTIQADADTVRAAVATEAGVRSWFTADAVVGEGVGAEHALGFPGVPEPWRLTVVESAPRRLVLAGQNGPWTGTTQTYELRETDGEGGVTLVFTHAGFPAQDDAYRSFTYGWATKFTALKAYAETGESAPFFE
ncbi:SRPBCC family protein [Streptacidiphilus jiangxiensis]|uniref:Activator of Hsp90 ATPase homolog 1-like protein n=1 Tax=Streptacidiphilus jiangxiensis TaxID=235985 RepID=A0A1H7LYB1_STRJI|nr:SRPBCC domain-containing protein [Streptacidiphilus jiangxiensis]SEL03990.1 Activator of Hsp90 ATPase homolog 1-like protein [Streptacidiphilus jiangxiensis]